MVIENLSWQQLIERYDRPNTLFYLDPPYYGCEKDYGPNVFSRDQVTVMAQHLMQIKGKFIVSLNDKPELREIFSAFNIMDVGLNYTIHGGAGTNVGEVVITNQKVDFLNKPLR